MKRQRVVLVALAFAGIIPPLLALGVSDRVRIPKAKPHPAGAPQEAALFSHSTHGVYKCYACHPSIFPQAPAAFTHADMSQGKFCGHCHDGQEAKAVHQLRCEACHAAR